MLVPFILGSKTDMPHAERIVAVLSEYGVPHELHVASAHKTPERVIALVEKYNQRQDAVCYITIAGRSNALSAVVAARAVHPVIACPPFKDKADYLVNIHSSLQAPSRVPVLTVVDPSNAARAAVRILALSEQALREKVESDIASLRA